jgi:dipeptidyl aminopeptidase/acylaminoacyl peptidase
MLTELQLEDNARWKQRYRAPAVFASQVAPRAPTKGILADNRSGTLQWYRWDVPSNQVEQITNTPGGHPSFLTMSPDGHWVYYLDDKEGNEIGHYVRMPAQGGDLEDITPDLPLYSSWGFSISRSGNRIGLMTAYENGFHVYCMDVDKDGTPGNLRKLYSSQRLLMGPLLSHDGDVLTVMSTERTGKPQFSLLAFDTLTGERISELWDGEENSLEMMVPSRLPGDPRLLASTTLTGIETLLIWNPRTGERTDLTFGDVTGAVRAFDWSPDGHTILLRTFNSAVQQLYLHDLSTGETRALSYPDGTNTAPYLTPDGDEIFSHWQSATHPQCVIALSTQTGAMVRTVISAGEVPPGREWKSVTFPSLDGQIIQGWLGIPDGDGPFPTVIETHGGPTAVQANVFHPGAQAWLDHGFAYLTVNYRGSTTFGREFEQKIWGQPGHWEIEDVVAARHWLVREKIAKADSILLTGWSYGGYLTLLGLGKAPELWAGGMAGIVIADWAMSYEDSAETLRGYQVSLLGGTPEQKPEQYRLSSPITYVENVQAPVLIIQGRNDSRTPARPVEVYEAKMRSLGKEIEVYWYDTGHIGSFTSIETGIRHQELMLRFAYRVLG